MADTIEKVQVEVEATAKGVSTVFKQLESQLGTIQKAMASIDTSKLNAVAKNINTSGMSKAERDISSSVDKIKQSLAGLKSYKDAALGGDSSSLTSLQRRIVSIQSAIDVLGEKLRQVGDNRTGINIDTEQFQEYRRQLAELQAMLEQTKDEAKNAAEEMSKEKPDVDTKSISEKLSGIKEKAISALKAIKKVASGIGSAFVSAGKGLKSIAARMLGVSGGLGKTTSSFKHGLRTLIKYGFGVRSLYVLFRRLRKAVTESFTELQKSGAMWQTTKANVEGLKTALSTLKFQFGAAFEPLFNVVAPALTSFINYLISLMNTISAFIAKLTGRSTYSKVAQVMSNTGSSAGSAGKAVKELNKQLQAFDELNNISPENNSGGGGSGGSGGGSTGATYTEESVESALGDFASALADKIKEGDWKGVGAAISEKLTEVLNDIPWNKIFKSAEQFGRNLADFLNGLITPDLFSALGTTIGNAIKTKLTFLNEFAKELDWSNLGESIASGLKAFVDTHPIVLLANTFSNWAKGITEGLATAIRNLLDNGTIQTISNDITEAISKIELGEIAWNIGSFISGLVNSIYVIVSNKETWKELGKKIGDGINGFFTSMNQVDIATGLTGWGALAKSASSLATGLLEMITKAIKTIKWKEVGQAIADIFNNIDWGQVIIDLGKLALAILEAIVDAIKGFWSNATWQGQIGAALVGIIAAAKLIGIKGVVQKLLDAKLGSQTFTSKIAGLILIAESIDIMGNNQDDGTVKGLGNNAKNDLIGAGATYGGLRLLGVSSTVALPITAITLALELGTDVGSYLGQEWADLLADEGIISREGADEYIRISKDRGFLGWKWWVDIGKASFETDKDGENRVRAAWLDFQYDLWEKTTGQEWHFQGGGKFFGNLQEYASQYIQPLVDTIKEKAKEEADKLAPFIQEHFGDAFNKAANLLRQWRAQEGVTYEFDDKGGIKHAYANNEKDNNYLTTLEYNLKFKFHNKEMTYEEFQAMMQLITALKNFPTFNKKSTYKFEVTGNGASGTKKPKDEINGLADSFKNLAETFTNKSAEYNIDVGGDVDNTDDIDKLGGSMNNLRKGWNGKDAKMTVNTSVDGYGHGIQGLSSLANDFKTKLLDKWDGKKANFTVTHSGDDKAAAAYNNLTGIWKNNDAKFTITSTGAGSTMGDLDTVWNYYKTWDGKMTCHFNLEAKLDETSLKDAFQRAVNAVDVSKLSISGAFGGSSPATKNAKGGVAYKATFGIFGEAGAEAIVPLERNTQWLGEVADRLSTNLVSTPTFESFASPPDTRFATYESTGYGSNSSDYLLTELVRETARQNDILEQILDKPSGITSSEVFRAVRTEGRSFKTRTGNSPFNY